MVRRAVVESIRRLCEASLRIYLLAMGYDNRIVYSALFVQVKVLLVEAEVVPPWKALMYWSCCRFRHAAVLLAVAVVQMDSMSLGTSTRFAASGSRFANAARSLAFHMPYNYSVLPHQSQ